MLSINLAMWATLYNEEYDKEDVAKVCGIPNVKFAYRTWHPGAYYKSGKPYYRYVESIVADVIKNFRL